MIYKNITPYRNENSASYPSVPSNTLRFMFSKSDYDPTEAGVGSSGTWAKKTEFPNANVWDWTNTNTDWNEAFKGAFTDEDNEVRVIAAGDTSDVVNISYLFAGELTGFAYSNYSLAHRNNVVSCVPFDVSSCVNFEGVFEGSTLREVVPFKYNPSLTYSGANAFSVIFADTYIENVVDLDFYGVNGKSSGLFARCTKLKKVSLKGLYNFGYVNNTFWGTNTIYCPLEEFKLTGNLNYGDLTLFFQNCRKLKKVSGLINNSNDVICQGTFLQCFELEELEFNVGSSGVRVDYLFERCYKMRNLPLINTSNTRNFLEMMYNCREVETIPDYDVSSATNVNSMCKNMYKAKYGILEMYNKLLARGAAITDHTDCFLNCGRDTEEGRAALSQIPASWGGTGT